jgi:hypothetical protein
MPAWTYTLISFPEEVLVSRKKIQDFFRSGFIGIGIIMV